MICNWQRGTEEWGGGVTQEIICIGEVEKESQIVKGTINENLKNIGDLTHYSQELNERCHQNGLG